MVRKGRLKVLRSFFLFFFIEWLMGLLQLKSLQLRVWLSREAWSGVSSSSCKIINRHRRHKSTLYLDIYTDFLDDLPQSLLQCTIL